MAKPEQYGYAVARLRAMERRFVDAGVLQRLLDADDLSGALKVLGETAYAAWMSDMKGDGAFDAVIEAELRHVYEEAELFVPDKAMLSILRMPYDFHNVKVVFKSIVRQKRGQSRRWDLLTSLGRFPTDDLISAMESEDFRLLPFNLPEVLPICYTLFEQTQDMMEIERRLDGALFSSMRKASATLGFAGVVAWVRARIDAENVRNLLRLKRIGKEVVAVGGFLHDGGWVSKTRCTELLNEPLESWGRALSYADVSRAFGEIEGEGNIERALVILERTLDDYISSTLERYAFEIFAPENVLRFLWHKEIEAKNVRVALVARANGMDRDMVRRLLRRV